MSQADVCYRVMFTEDGKVRELFARYICEESLIGFVEVEELLFVSPQSGLVVDTQAEQLAQAFKGVKRTYLPLHNIIRIDEMDGGFQIQQGFVVESDQSNVSYLSSTAALTKPEEHHSGGEK